MRRLCLAFAPAEERLLTCRFPSLAGPFAHCSIYTRKWSAVSLCSGIIAGLVGITPAAGFVGTPSSLAIGFLTAVAANFATGFKVLLKIDDAVDGFAIHGIGGFVYATLRSQGAVL